MLYTANELHPHLELLQIFETLSSLMVWSHSSSSPPSSLCGGDVVLTSAWQSVLCGAQMFRVSRVSTRLFVCVRVCVFVSLGAGLSLIHGLSWALVGSLSTEPYTHTHSSQAEHTSHSPLQTMVSFTFLCLSLSLPTLCAFTHKITPLISNSHPESIKLLFFFLPYLLTAGKLRTFSSC